MNDHWKKGHRVLLFVVAALALLYILFLGWCASACAQPFVMAKHKTYSVVYDYARMNPAVVLWQLEASDFKGAQLAKPKHFKMDRLLPKPRWKNDDFAFTNFHRGHLCPGGDRDAQSVWYNDTFYTSNIVLMTPVSNTGAWKETEDWSRKQCTVGHVLRIAAGPVWYRTTPVSNTIKKPYAPPAMFKVATCVLHPNEQRCWIVPNDDQRRHECDCISSLDSLSKILDEVTYKYLFLWLRK